MQIQQKAINAGEKIDLINHLEIEHIANRCWSFGQARSTAHTVCDNAEEDEESAYSGNKAKTTRILCMKFDHGTYRKHVGYQYIDLESSQILWGVFFFITTAETVLQKVP